MDVVITVGTKMKRCHSGLDATTSLEGRPRAKLCLLGTDEQPCCLLLQLQGTCQLGLSWCRA